MNILSNLIGRFNTTCFRVADFSSAKQQLLSDITLPINEKGRTVFIKHDSVKTNVWCLEKKCR
jgi:hypothetical protein